jgi:DMSO reductase family type II enzyme heme b subunit
MKVSKTQATDRDLLDGASSSWREIKQTRVEMIPSPVGMAEGVSPFMALSENHGVVKEVNVKLASNGTTLSIRLSWADPNEDASPDDLDQFVDGAAVMFPFVDGASALSMGDRGAPVNAWLWKADEEAPRDVVAEGYSTSLRRKAEASGLKAHANYSNKHWTLVFQRPLVATEDFISLSGEATSGIAIAIWEGSNAERAGQKSVSGEFDLLEGLS